MTVYVHRCMVVPADLAPLARSLAEGLEPQAAAGMFAAPLSATSEEPATHYVSTGMIEDVFAGLLVDANALFAACGPFGVTLAQCQDLVTRSDVSDQPPFDAFARLGLRIVQPPQVLSE